MKTWDDTQRLERSRRRAHFMVRLQQGDADACKELFDDIGPSLTNFLRRRVADPQELEDVYQEVFMAIFEARHTYEPGRPFEPWLFAIARNIAADYSRRRWRRAHWEELVADPPEHPADTSSGAVPELSSLSQNSRLIRLRRFPCLNSTDCRSRRLLRRQESRLGR
jgi:RNA polymerase sigma factor (sigma-70 family)